MKAGWRNQNMGRTVVLFFPSIGRSPQVFEMQGNCGNTICQKKEFCYRKEATKEAGDF